MAVKRTYTIIVDGETFGNVIDLPCALLIASQYLNLRKSVIVRDNAARKTCARFIYGHRQT